MMDLELTEDQSRPMWKFDWDNFAAAAADEVGQYVLDVLQDEAPVDSGQMRDSMDYRFTTSSDGLRIEWYSPETYAMYVLKGTPPHDIVPRTASVLHFIASSGEEVFTQHVSHPGTQPNPFNARAWDLARDVVVATLGELVQESIT